MKNFLKHKFRLLILTTVMLASSLGSSSLVFAAPPSGPYCGGSDDYVSTAIDFGCTHQGNPITDLLFAVVRLLSDGVGLVVIASVIVGGIQYTVSRGDPQAAAAAVKRIQSALMALFIYLFGWALLQWLIPGGFFNST